MEHIIGGIGCKHRIREFFETTALKEADEILERDFVVQVTIEPYKESRSLAQNRLYWRWIGQIAAATGHSKREIADYYQSELLEPVTGSFLGETTESIRSTKDLSADDFSNFLMQMQAEVAGGVGVELSSFGDLLNKAMGIK